MNERRRERPENAHRITKVYTRTGDLGRTRLVGGQEVPKNHPRLGAYGTVDELQAAIGAAGETLAETFERRPALAATMSGRIGEHLAYIQNMLFTVNGDLATRIEDRWDGMPLPTPADVRYIEELIDRLNADLPPLRDFVLPGGAPAVTAMHVCRVVCRRAEREVETLAAAEPIGEGTRPVLNRLSDLFFVLARRVAADLKAAGAAPEERIWQRDLNPPPLP